MRWDADSLAMVKALEGRSLWAATRAADMEMFQFGERVTHEFRGKTRTVREYALHVESAWRISRDGTILVGISDHWVPPGGGDSYEFDPADGRRTYRDELLEAFMEHGEEAHRVIRAAVTDLGDLSIGFADGCALEVFCVQANQPWTPIEAQDEHWRLFRPGVDAERHLVITVGGIEP